MNEKKQSIIEKIQKILLLAKDQRDTPEGRAATRSAALLMAKYRINETEIDLETDSFCLDTFRVDHDNGSLPQWVSRLVCCVVDTFDCKNIVRHLDKKSEFEIIGTFSDVETSIYFTETIYHHINSACWVTWNNIKNSRKRVQLGNEAVDIIYDRLRELKNTMNKTIHEDNSCSALVIRKNAQVLEAMTELYPNLFYTKGKKIDYAVDSKTKNAGQSAGKSCPLNFAIN